MCVCARSSSIHVLMSGSRICVFVYNKIHEDGYAMIQFWEMIDGYFVSNKHSYSLHFAHWMSVYGTQWIASFGLDKMSSHYYIKIIVYLIVVPFWLLYVVFSAS